MKTILRIWHQEGHVLGSASTHWSHAMSPQRAVEIPEPYQVEGTPDYEPVHMPSSERWEGYSMFPNLFRGSPAAGWRLGLRHG